MSDVLVGGINREFSKTSVVHLIAANGEQGQCGAWLGAAGVSKWDVDEAKWQDYVTCRRCLLCSPPRDADAVEK